MAFMSSGSGMEMENPIPKFREQEGNKESQIREWKGFEKSSFWNIGNGNRTLSFPGMAWNGNGNGKKILTGNITKIWEQEGKEISPFPKFGDGKERKTQFTKFVNSIQWL